MDEKDRMTKDEWDAFVEMVLEEEKRINAANISRMEKGTRKMRLVNIADKVKRILMKEE